MLAAREGGVVGVAVLPREGPLRQRIRRRGLREGGILPGVAHFSKRLVAHLRDLRPGGIGGNRS